MAEYRSKKGYVSRKKASQHMVVLALRWSADDARVGEVKPALDPPSFASLILQPDFVIFLSLQTGKIILTFSLIADNLSGRKG